MNLASLREYAKHKDGTYVAFEMSQASKDLLDNFVQMNLGLTERVDKSAYHTTVIYSRTPVPSAERHKGFSENQSASVIGYEVFPTKNDGKCLVMRIQCPFAEELNKQLTIEGATSDYPEYKPHVTLAYNMTQEVDPATMPLPQFDLVFDTLKVEPLDAEYTPKNADN